MFCRRSNSSSALLTQLAKLISQGNVDWSGAAGPLSRFTDWIMHPDTEQIPANVTGVTVNGAVPGLKYVSVIGSPLGHD